MDCSITFRLLQEGMTHSHIPHYVAEVERFTKCCEDNFFNLIVTKIKELLIVFRKKPTVVPPVTMVEIVERVEKCKYLEVIFDSKLMCDSNVSTIY